MNVQAAFFTLDFTPIRISWKGAAQASFAAAAQ